MDGPWGALRSFLGSSSRRPEEGPKDKDFWIADSMATVCYDCDAPFSLLLRRHHCRHCGRLFCAKCTAHSLPATAGAPGGDPVRVCNFCFQRSRSGGAAAAEEPRDGEDSGGDDAPPLNPAAQLLRRGTLTASAALAAFVEPLWASASSSGGGALASTRPGDGDDAGEGGHPAQSEEGVRALASFLRGGEEEESDSDSEGLTAQVPLAASALRNAALASLLEDLGNGEEAAQDGSLSGGTSTAAAAPARTGAAAEEADLLPASSESTDVGDAHPLSAREDAIGEAGDAREAASAAAADASFTSWLADLHARDAASQEVPSPGPPAGWCSGEAVFEAGDDAAASSVWAPPQPPPSGEAGDTTAAAACRAALHEAGAVHLRAVVRQALVAGGVPHAEEWVPILADLAAAAAAAIQPSSAGGAGYSMDPRDYVCVKRIPGGQRGDSRLVRGVACRRSVAHKRMATTVEAPRLLLLGGALQYQRVEGRLSSLDTLLEQERAHLRVACARAVALQPQVVLVEKSCARYAQELLLTAGVSLVLNVKPAVLRRLAAATGAQVAPGCDALREGLHLGSCGAFRCEALAEEHGPPREQSRTLMVFDGCPRALCATVLLCGGPPEELARVKGLTPWAVLVAHHLRLEAAFLGDALAACGTAPETAQGVVDDALRRVAAASPHGLLLGLSPHVRPSRALRPPPPSPAAAAAAWAAGVVRADERLMVSLCCRSPAKLLLCEPHNARVIHHYCGTDVPLGHFLAAALPAPGRRCGCGDGPEAHVRSYASGEGRLTLRVRSAAQGALQPAARPRQGDIWHWAVCAACLAQGRSSPGSVVRLSDTAAHLSLGRFLELSLAAPDLLAPCGHSMHGCCVRVFCLAQGTVAVALAPQARLATQLPRRTLFHGASASVSTWLAAELEELSAAARAAGADIRAQLAASWAEHSASAAQAGVPSPREPPVLVSALEAVVEEEQHSLLAKVRDAAAQCATQPDAFVVNRLKRLLASTRRKWTAALGELHTSGWRSSFPVDARRGWASDDGSSSPSPASLPALSPSQPHSRGAPGWEAPQLPPPGRALLPLGVGGAAVVVYDDEPTSVIAFALASQRFASLVQSASASAAAAPPVAPAPGEPRAQAALDAAGVAWPVVASSDPAHVRLQFEERAPGGDAASSARFCVIAYFAPQFQALRSLWGVTTPQLLKSLCRCARWESSGGKSGAYFAKTRDDALVVKALSRPELASALEFAPAYAAYTASAAATDTCVLLAKLVGVFTVNITVPGRRDTKMDVVVLDNLFAGGGFAPVYDLKGAAGRQRAAPGDAPVLLDENLGERAAQDAPLRVSPSAAVALTSAVWRDTAFLARLGVMDYSMLVGLQGGTLVVGIVDYLRQYTWDKQLETYVKSSSAVLSGQQAQQPTVISPKEYARRFRKAMRAAFVVLPDIGGLEGLSLAEEDAKQEAGQPAA